MSAKRFIITRDYELPNGEKGRQCWTGKTWSKEIDQVLVFHNYIEARVAKARADRATQRNLKLRVPGLKIMKCDIRQLLPEDFPGR